MITDNDRELARLLIQCAAKIMGVTEQDLFSSCRRQELVTGRTLVYDRLRILGYSWYEIGQLTGRDHSTAICCVKELQQRIGIYPVLRCIYNNFQLLVEQRIMAKYHNRTFTNKYGKWDSELEFYRYLFLLNAEKKGLISGLQRQVRFELVPSQRETTMIDKETKRGVVRKTKTYVVERPVDYTADFVYVKADTGLTVIEDTKGYRTQDYIIRRKLMRWQGNPIREVVNSSEPI